MRPRWSMPLPRALKGPALGLARCLTNASWLARRGHCWEQWDQLESLTTPRRRIRSSRGGSTRNRKRVSVHTTNWERRHKVLYSQELDFHVGCEFLYSRELWFFITSLISTDDWWLKNSHALLWVLNRHKVQNSVMNPYMSTYPPKRSIHGLIHLHPHLLPFHIILKQGPGMIFLPINKYHHQIYLQ